MTQTKNTHAAEAAKRMLGDDHPTDPKEFWEAFYSRDEKPWTGNPNHALVTELAEHPLTPTAAIDLGCGSGADVVWLAEAGWEATGVDIAEAALATGKAAAAKSGAEGRTHWEQHDLDNSLPEGQWDLVVASYLHSPVEFGRTEAVARAAQLVAPGGTLMIIGHEGPPSWAPEMAEHLADLPRAEQVREDLALADWETVSLRTVEVPMRAPDGSQGHRVDNVLRLRRPGQQD